MSVRIPKKKASKKAGLATIECSCRTVIMLVPNVKIMSAAIEAHVEEHIKRIKDRKEADAEAERVRDNLLTQILEKASKTD